MMSEIMEKEYAKESDQDLLDRKDVIDGISKIIDDRLFSKQPLSLAITVSLIPEKDFCRPVVDFYFNPFFVAEADMARRLLVH